MIPRFLLDENQRGPLWDAIERHNEFSSTPIDAVRVGDHGAPPLATLDPEILSGAKKQAASW